MRDVQKHYEDGPEALIVSLATRGDRAAFSELVRRRQVWIRGLFRRFCNEPTLADDLSQRVFLKMWKQIRSLKHPERFAGWLKRIAINEWIDHQRKYGSDWDESFDEDAQSTTLPSPSTAIDLNFALSELPPQVRTCMVLAYHECMTHPEIVEATGLPAGTVKSHIRRGSARLRERLKDYEVTS